MKITKISTTNLNNEKLKPNKIKDKLAFEESLRKEQKKNKDAEISRLNDSSLYGSFMGNYIKSIIDHKLNNDKI